GRLFDARDEAAAPKVALVNQSMAYAFWGNKSALGRRIRPAMTDEWYTVVGVIVDVKNKGLDKPTGTEFYLPYTQAPAWLNSFNIAIRSDLSLATVVGAARQVLHDIDPTLPVTKIRAMDEVVTASQSSSYFLTLLLMLFAGVALILAAVGIYGVISY